MTRWTPVFMGRPGIDTDASEGDLKRLGRFYIPEPYRFFGHFESSGGIPLFPYLKDARNVVFFPIDLERVFSEFFRMNTVKR